MASDRPLTILFLTADPRQVSQARLEQETRDIRQRLRHTRARTGFRLEQCCPQSLEDIDQALRDIAPHIVHFCGHSVGQHGQAQAGLRLADASGQLQPIPPETLAALLAPFADQIDCLFFNSCYWDPQVEAVIHRVASIIGTDQEMDNQTAIAFAVHFYRALGAHNSVETAYEFGCAEIQSALIPGYSLPLIHLKEVWTTKINGSLKLSEAGTLIAADEPARQLCCFMGQQNTHLTTVPQPIWDACEQLIQQRDLFQEQPLRLEETVQQGQAGQVRLQVQWVEATTEQSAYLQVSLEEKAYPLAIAESQKYGLTCREAEVWLLQQAHHTVQQIADKLHIAVNTVKQCIKSIQTKQQDVWWVDEP